MVWIKFLICAAIVVFAGSKLSKYGDAIAEKTSLTGAWVGLLLLATITSMPELVTSISAVSVVDVPDLAVGMILGSNLFNLLIIGILDIQYREGPLLSAVKRQHILSAGFCVLIIAIAGTGILIGNRVVALSLGGFDLFSLLLLVSYMISLRVISGFEQEIEKDFLGEEAQRLNYSHMSLRRTYLSFAAASLAIVGASIWLATIGDEIADVTGWEASFVGSLFLAVISSLPELVVCTSALKIGAVDMAIADVLGSNMFNTGIIIAASDIFYRKGSILASSSMGLAWAALIAVAMTVIVIMGVRFSSKHKALKIASWEVPMLIALWVIGAYVLFTS
ncbi:MAG: sodium:calcium antiporter [Chloroflexota bacterium]|nr:sodium:calcium antiporter [Chloroflexota bacterium]